MINVLFVCLGNICRSPMAQFVLQNMVDKRRLSDKFYIDSAGTTGENEAVGAGIYCDTKAILKDMKVPFSEHLSRKMKIDDYEKFDYILAMEDRNISDILRIIGDDPKQKVHRLLDFTEQPRDIADPWYYGNFDSTFYDIEYGCEEFLKYLFKSGKLTKNTD